MSMLQHSSLNTKSIDIYRWVYIFSIGPSLAEEFYSDFFMLFILINGAGYELTYNGNSMQQFFQPQFEGL